MQPTTTRTRREDPKPSRRQESLIATSERAQEAQQRAQQYFLAMIEGPVQPQVFVDKARYINPQIYSDVVEERAVAGLCGYPVCPNFFTDTYGHRTYVIRHNNVYDITQRRSFCSNVCYEASELVRRQVLRLPLYLRDTDDSDIKDICLPDLAKLKGRHGKLVDITGGISQMEMGDSKKSPKRPATSFMSVDDIARESLVNWSENEANLNKDQTTSDGGDKKENDGTDHNRTEEGDSDNLTKGKSTVSASNENPELECVDMREGDETPGLVAIEEEEEEVSEEKILEKNENDNTCEESLDDDDSNTRTRSVCSKLSDTHEQGMSHRETQKPNCDEHKKETHNSGSQDDAKSTGEASSLHDVLKVESVMRQWMTFDSLRVVLGDRYLQGMLEHLGRSWDKYDTTAGLRLSVEVKARYIAICRKLEHDERLEIEGHDTLDQQPETETWPSKPVPDYGQLQQEAKKQQLKVVCFFGGNDQYEEPVEKLDTIPEGDEAGTRPSVKRKLKPEKQSQDGDIRVPTLPFVDSYSQTAWRHNIVTEKVTIYLQQMLEMTRLSFHEIRKLLRPLVATFHLTPDNISFHPKQWRLITLILLKMLSVRYPVIQDALKTEEGLSIQNTILSTYSLDLGYSNRVISFLTEMQHVLSKDFKEEKAETMESQTTNVAVVEAE